MRKLPTFKGYTVDFRLREFRKAVFGKCLVFISFDGKRGKRLLADYRRYMETKNGGNKFIGVWTIGMMQESSETREVVEKEFNRQARKHDDWLYTVVIDGKKFFVAENGEFGYTAMLPEEY